MSVPNTRVVFFQTANTTVKLACITETARSHFIKKESLLFFVEDEKAERFLDELLWKLPPASFLPHAISDPSSLISITSTKTNITQTHFAFNLCPTPLLLPGFKIIYDLEDLSSPHKQTFSTKRFEAYKAARLPIESKPASLS